jgi:hypothetical protein
MKIFRKWILKWLQKAHEENDRDQKMRAVEEPMHPGYGTISSANNYATHKEDVPLRMHFNVMPASGGVVISINNYDRKSGRHIENLHVIHDDEDIATNIGQIVSLELLKSQ